MRLRLRPGKGTAFSTLRDATRRVTVSQMDDIRCIAKDSRMMMKASYNAHIFEMIAVGENRSSFVFLMLIMHALLLTAHIGILARTSERN